MLGVLVGVEYVLYDESGDSDGVVACPQNLYQLQ